MGLDMYITQVNKSGEEVEVIHYHNRVVLEYFENKYKYEMHTEIVIAKNKTDVINLLVNLRNHITGYMYDSFGNEKEAQAYYHVAEKIQFVLDNQAKNNHLGDCEYKFSADS